MVCAKTWEEIKNLRIQYDAKKNSSRKCYGEEHHVYCLAIKCPGVAWQF